MNYNILVTSNFKKEAKQLKKKYSSLASEIKALIIKLEKEPKSGIAIGKNCYKIRLAIKSKGKGKSGGARIITLVKIIDKEVHLLSIFDKSKKENISDHNINIFINSIDL